MMQETNEEKEVSPKEKKAEGRFSAKRIAKIALFAALAYAVSWIEIPVMSWTPLSFLKLDLANVFVLLSGFLFGPIACVLVELTKELLRLITTQTGGIGELSNFVISMSFCLVPAIVYHFKKGLPTVIFTLLVGCVLQIAMGYLSNYFVMFPLYMGKEVGQKLCLDTWQYIVLFNAIKAVSVSLITILLYKRLRRLLDKI